MDTALADKECYGLETPDARMTCFVNKVDLFSLGSSRCLYSCFSVYVLNVFLLKNGKEQALVNVGGELSKLVPGRVSTEVDARLAYDTHAIIGKVQKCLSFYVTYHAYIF